MLTLIVFISIIFSCSKKITQTTEVSLTDTSQQKQTVTVNENNLQAGKYLMVTHCTGCHALREPLAYSKEKWNIVLPVMFKKAKLTDENEMQLISEYVYANLNSK